MAKVITPPRGRAKGQRPAGHEDSRGEAMVQPLLVELARWILPSASAVVRGWKRTARAMAESATTAMLAQGLDQGAHEPA